MTFKLYFTKIMMMARPDESKRLQGSRDIFLTKHGEETESDDGV